MGYGFQNYQPDRMARASTDSAPVSTRHWIEIASLLRQKDLQKAKKILERVLELKQPVPFNRFDKGMGHKHGMAAGSYPIKAGAIFLTLLNSVEANAQSRGLNANNLTIVHIEANKAGNRRHGGRHGGRVMKRSHIEVVVAESEAKPTEKKSRAKPAEKTEGTA